MAKALGMQSGNYNAFLQGNKGLSAEATCLLLKFTAMTKKEAIVKFSAPIPTCQITNFQSLGQSMELDNDGWVSREGGRPKTLISWNGDITTTPDADTHYDQATVDLLRQVRGYHRIAIKAINGYLNKARPNPNGMTDPTGQRFSTRNIRKTLVLLMLLQAERLVAKLQLEQEMQWQRKEQERKHRAANPTVTLDHKVDQAVSMMRHLRKKTSDIHVELEMRRRLKAEQERYQEAAAELREANLTAEERGCEPKNVARPNPVLPNLTGADRPSWREEATLAFKNKKL